MDIICPSFTLPPLCIKRELYILAQNKAKSTMTAAWITQERNSTQKEIFPTIYCTGAQNTESTGHRLAKSATPPLALPALEIKMETR